MVLALLIFGLGRATFAAGGEYLETFFGELDCNQKTRSCSLVSEADGAFGPRRLTLERANTGTAEPFYAPDFARTYVRLLAHLEDSGRLEVFGIHFAPPPPRFGVLRREQNHD